MSSDEIMNSQIGELKQLSQLSPSYREYYEKILLAQYNSLTLLDPNKIKTELSSSFIQQKLDKNISALDIDLAELDSEYLHSLLNHLIDIMLNYNIHLTEDILSFKALMNSSNFSLTHLLKEYLNDNIDYINQLHLKTNIIPDMFIFLSQMLLRPVLGLYSELIRQQLPQLNSENGCCPICGKKAAMSRLENDTGRRILWCSLCNTEYYFSRMKCIYCLNDNQNNLKYFYTDEKSPYRVDICENCLNYVKTIDERRCDVKKNYYMYIEDIGTIDLDIIAVREGYKNIFNFLTSYSS